MVVQRRRANLDHFPAVGRLRLGDLADLQPVERDLGSDTGTDGCEHLDLRWLRREATTHGPSHSMSRNRSDGGSAPSHTLRRSMRAVVFTGPAETRSSASSSEPSPSRAATTSSSPCATPGLNPADIAQRAGRYPAPPGSPADIPGIEVAGTVIRPGADRATVRPGGPGLRDRRRRRARDRVLVHERHVTEFRRGSTSSPRLPCRRSS